MERVPGPGLALARALRAATRCRIAYAREFEILHTRNAFGKQLRLDFVRDHQFRFELLLLFYLRDEMLDPLRHVVE